MSQLKTGVFEQKYIAAGRNFCRKLNEKLSATQWFLLLYAVGFCTLLTVAFLLKLAIKFL